MMTDIDFLRRISEMNIVWDEHPNGGFAAEINGVLLHLCGNEVAPITLIISRGFRRHTICQPLPFSRAPAGRLAKWIRKKCGAAEQSADEKLEKSVEEEMHSLLENLLEQAHKQYRKHCSSAAAYDAYRRQRNQELYMQVIFGEGGRAFK
jgi:histone H3/H4